MQNNPGISSAMIHVTESCNMACDYCYEDHYSSIMTKETAAAILQFLMQGTGQKEVMIFGGEPFIATETISFMLDYLRENHHDAGLRVPIMTNGTIFNESVRSLFDDEFNRKVIGLQISIDGLEAQHDVHRKMKSGEGSFQRIVDNIPKFLEVRPMLTVRLTLSPESIPGLAESIKLFHGMGVKYFAFMPVIEAVYNNEHIEMMKDELAKLVDYMYECYESNEFIYIDKLQVHYDKRTTSLDNPCEAGKSLVTFTSTGDVYPCHRFRWLEDSGQFYMGNIIDGIEFSILDRFKQYTNTGLANCQSCKADRCNKCAAVNWFLNKDINNSASHGYCKIPPLYEAAAEALSLKLMNSKNLSSNIDCVCNKLLSLVPEK